MQTFRTFCRSKTATFATVLAVGAGLLFAIDRPAEAGIVPAVAMGTADSYSVLGASTVTNTGSSVLGQSVGLSPGTAITGFPPGVVLAPGTIEAANATTLQAQSDLTTAYVDAASRSVEVTLGNSDLVGQTLVPGVYAATAKAPLSLSGQLILDGQGNPNAVFIFQTDSTLTTSVASSIALTGGALACNVFWQVGSSATLGVSSTFVGNILALVSITVGTSASVHGRTLARNGAVTLDNNVFNKPGCTSPGALSITVPSDAGSLGSAANTAGGSTISGQLGEVQVTDTRSATTGWVASAVSTAFTSTGSTIAASNVGYSAGTITKVGTATYTANDPPDLTVVSPVVTATAITGHNSATWNPTISVFVPGGTTTGVYSAIITHSVT
ncbi:ice-binding family protein [Ilumatobacter sp.]|uniref:ice-binding family protein n=1 Tax=Ilumatobacter sp. TaxID=1967498 RepID=UPI0037530856